MNLQSRDPACSRVRTSEYVKPHMNKRMNWQINSLNVQRIAELRFICSLYNTVLTRYIFDALV
jgi:hypothetical protein